MAVKNPHLTKRIFRSVKEVNSSYKNPWNYYSASWEIQTEMKGILTRSKLGMNRKIQMFKPMC